MEDGVLVGGVVVVWVLLFFVRVFEDCNAVAAGFGSGVKEAILHYLGVLKV